MGNEINGYGKTVYLQASQNETHPPLSQDNVRLTPNFNDVLPSALGAQPTVMDSTIAVNEYILKVLGSVPSMEGVVVTKDPVTGKYSISFQVASMSLTTGSYLQEVQMSSNTQNLNTGVRDGWIKLGDKWKYMKSGIFMKDEWIQYDNNWFYLGHDEYMVTNWKEIKGHWYYFAPEDGHMKKGKKYIDGKWYYLRLTDQNGNEVDSNYMVTGWRKLNGEWYYFKTKEEDTSGRNQFGYMICESWREIDGEWYYFHEDGVMASDEWVGEYYLGANGVWNPEEELEDEKVEGREITFPDKVTGTLNGNSYDLKPNKNWFSFKNNGTGVIKDSSGNYFKISVGPCILIPDYPEHGKLELDDFGGSLNVRIDVALEEIATGKEKTIECIATGIKAHTYNIHPDKTEGQKHKIFNYNRNITASFDIDSGYIQTGIAYPNCSNGKLDKEYDGPIALDHMNSSSIEFTGTTSGIGENKYKLIKIIVRD